MAQVIWQRKCDFDKTIRKGSALEGNLKVVLNSLVENVNKTSYIISFHGQNGDKVYGLAQCLGYVNASACQECISNATKTLQVCTEIRRSIILRGCYLKINTQNFYSKLDLSGIGYNGAYGDTGGWDLDPSIVAIMMKVMDDAVSSNVGFSTGNASCVLSNI